MAMPPSKRPPRRERGSIDALASGALRVRVYAGTDALTGHRHDLTETVPRDHPDAANEAVRVRTRLLNQIDEQRHPRTKATVNELMDRYLELLDVDATTRRTYDGYIRIHVRPLIGSVSLSRLDGETLDSFYLVLRTCRVHCDGRPFVEHRSTDPEHACDEKCRQHSCHPLATSSIHQIHGCLSGALKRAIRWRWISVNPLDQAEPLRTVTSDPDPPTPEQAAAIVNEAFKDWSWGVLVWLAMTTGARRGELCAVRWDRLDLDRKLLSIRTSIAQLGALTWEKDTKTHQQRRIALDEATVGLLRAYRDRCDADAAELSVTLAGSARLFSLAGDHSTWIKPDSVTQRYRRMCARLGWKMHIHQLRHYSATDLIAAGVDVRTVAGRLGHGGGGATTLRVYSAWVSEADQRAASNMKGRMSLPPAATTKSATERGAAVIDENAPYRRIAADLRGAIASGVLKPGDPLPAMKEIAEQYDVALSTAHRAVSVLTSAGIVNASRGRRAVVAETRHRAGLVAARTNADLA